MNQQKINERIKKILTYETDDFFLKIDIKKEIRDKVYDYQYLHIFDLITSIRINKVTLDGSDTGTGKTYTTIAICYQMNLRPFIICPKIMIKIWMDVCKYYNVKPLAIVNYETIKNGKFYDDYERVECKYIIYNKGDNCKKKQMYQWNLPKNVLIIFDEAHKCRNPKSLNGILLKSTLNTRDSKILLLSATISDKIKNFALFGLMLGFYKNMNQANNWLKGKIIEDQCNLDNRNGLSAINKAIYPQKGSRMSISELGEKFIKNEVDANCYPIDNEKKKLIEEYYEKYRKASTQEYKEVDQNLPENSEKLSVKKKNNAEALVKMLKYRQKIEELKIPLYVEIAKEYLEEEISVVIFMNFKKNIEIIAKILNTRNLIQGEVGIDNRNAIIDNFQSNKENLIICNSAAIDGISLHDLHGKRRAAIISPMLSSSNLIQVLGRINRKGTKTVPIQKIIFAADTVEEKICIKLKEKLNFLSKLNTEIIKLGFS